MRNERGTHIVEPVFIIGPPPAITRDTHQVQERPGRIEYLYLTDVQKVVVEEMNDAIDELPPLTRLRCQLPEARTVRGKEVMYYQHMDYDERTPPTPREADLMCRTQGVLCPLAETCFKLGITLAADHGVWGGRTLVDGEQHNLGGRK